MMNRTVLQIPIDGKLRDNASVAANKLGFSSLQEFVRVVLTKLDAGQIDIAVKDVEPPEPKISTSAINRYQKMTQEHKTSKANTKSFKNTKETMSWLRS